MKHELKILCDLLQNEMFFSILVSWSKSLGIVMSSVQAFLYKFIFQGQIKNFIVIKSKQASKQTNPKQQQNQNHPNPKKPL